MGDPVHRCEQGVALRGEGKEVKKGRAWPPRARDSVFPGAAPVEGGMPSSSPLWWELRLSKQRYSLGGKGGGV